MKKKPPNLEIVQGRKAKQSKKTLGRSDHERDSLRENLAPFVASNPEVEYDADAGQGKVVIKKVVGHFDYVTHYQSLDSLHEPVLRMQVMKSSRIPRPSGQRAGSALPSSAIR